MATVLTWAGIVLCISQSAVFSGMNLAVFSISRLRLEAEAAAGNPDALRLLVLRRDSNFVLTTVLWGNVGINVLLTLLSSSVLAGVTAFAFSTVAITFLGELLPQAYFSRHALKMASRFFPLIRFYQYLLYPVTRSSAALLDWWLGKESIQYFREHNFREIIKRHIEAGEGDIDRIEGLGALNFLAIDDLSADQEGELLDPRSIIPLCLEADRPRFPAYAPDPSDPFLRQIEQSGKKWVVFTDPETHPVLVLDADSFLRHALFNFPPPDPALYCHAPITVDPATELGHILHRLRPRRRHAQDDLLEEDIILVWGDHPRIITGSDILGRLMRGISDQELAVAQKTGC